MRNADLPLYQSSLATSLTGLLLFMLPACDGSVADQTDDDADELADINGAGGDVNFADGVLAIDAKMHEYDNSILDFRAFVDARPFSVPGGVAQSYADGTTLIVWSRATGAHPIWSSFRQVFARDGINAGLAKYGFPSSDYEYGDANMSCKDHYDPAAMNCQNYTNGYALCIGAGGGDIVECMRPAAPPAVVTPPEEVPPIEMKPPIAEVPPPKPQWKWNNVVCSCTGAGELTSQGFPSEVFDGAEKHGHVCADPQRKAGSTPEKQCRDVCRLNGLLTVDSAVLKGPATELAQECKPYSPAGAGFF